MKRYIFTVIYFLTSLTLIAQVGQSSVAPENVVAVDLGLPSGTRWANMNVGASSPEESGKYFAWGETEEKSVYNWSNYSHCDGSRETCRSLDGNICGTQYDVAHVKWRGYWRMPTLNEIEELVANCTCTVTELNSVPVMKLTGPNGNFIYLPFTGFMDGKERKNAGYDSGYYWSGVNSYSNTLASCMVPFSNGNVSDNNSLDKYLGIPVRPVMKVVPSVPRTFIDLGLPSGTKWANMNIGANRPEEYGKYFAWGETIEKDSYTWDNYMCPESTCGKPGDPVFDFVGDKADIVGTKFDAAAMSWGASWNMPTAEQIKELASNCSSSLLTINGVPCRKLVSRINGNEIIFPLAGARWYDTFAYEGTLGYYWSSTLRQGGYVSPGRFIVRDDTHGWGWSMGGENDRFSAFPIRPVYVENNIVGDTVTLHKFSAAFNDSASTDLLGSGITFQRDGTAENYSLSADGQQGYDSDFDISKISYITRKSIGQFSLPDASGLKVSDITITADGDTISTDDKGNYDAAGSTLVATNKEGEVVYMNIAAVEGANNATGADLNAKESAITLMLPLVPNIFVAFDDEYLPHLKEMIWDVDEVKQLAAAIDRSVTKYGYTDFGEISKEATAAKNKISKLLHLDELSERQAKLASMANKMPMQMAPGTKIPPYIVNPYGYGGLQVEITNRERKQYYLPHNIYGYNCEVTAYNSNRFAYSSIVKGKYDAETKTYYIPDSGSDYDYYKNILKPQKVSTFLNTFTSYKEEDLNRLGLFLVESVDLLQGNIGFNEMHWDDMKTTAYFDINAQDDAIVLLFPRGNDYMLVYNILQSIIKPIVKTISKKAAKAFDSDIFFPIVIGKMLNNPDYILEVWSTLNNSDLSTLEKTEKIRSLSWTNFFKVITNEAKDFGDDLLQKSITYLIDETSLIEGGIQAALDWTNVKAAFKVLGWVKKYGDIFTGVLGTFFEDNAVYPIYLEANGQFVLAQNEVTVGKGESVKVRIIVGGNSYSCESSDEEVATVRGSYNKVEITGVDAGDAVITVKDKVTQKTAKIKVHVTGIQNFILAESEVSVPMYKDRSVTIERGDGPIHIFGGDENIAVAKLGRGNPMIFPGDKYTVVVSGVSEGTTTFNVYDEATDQTLPLTVTVTAEDVTITDERIVDLGLSVNWANCNVGANSPEEYGDYFAWGEVDSKDYYSVNNYKYYSNGNFTDIGSDISGTAYDAATHNMGEIWRMPTKAEYEELINKCEWKFVTYRKKRGWQVTGPSGNSIFLPAAGFMLDDWNDHASIEGFYWSSNVTDTPREVHTLYTTMSDYKMSYRYMNRYEGRTIRAVTVAENVNTLKLSETSIAIQLKEQKTVNITSGSGQYSVKSNNTSVATASLSGTAITVKGVSKGSATITVTDTKTKQTATIAVTVTDGAVVEGQTITVNGVSFKMIGVEGGTFWMGEAESFSGYGDEIPRHQVTLSNFAIGQTEVTQELWEAVMGSNPSDFKGAKRPVENVSWDDCQIFITKLNQLTGKMFRLPTEAEWEYAARGGKQSKGYVCAGSNTIGDVAWHGEDNSSDGTKDVATKQPNELGLYDMSGNVWEWCQDWYGSDYYSSSPQINPTGPSDGSVRVKRGGSWNYYVWACRVTFRSSGYPYSRKYYNGLRLAMDDSQSDVSPGEAIDLGLPSGTLWASCNVGATKPEEYGDYFAWGETTPKKDYSWETYKWCDNVDNDLTKYCNDSNYGYNGFTDTKTELDLEDDAAYVNWGGDWRMPSWEQQKELLDNCTSELMQLNGVYGRKVTGPNGNSIFLPMASWYWRTELESANFVGRYWSRSLYRYPIYASYLQLQVDWEVFEGSSFTRCFGYSVRPVKEKK